jgi:hypothetical protein
MRNALLAQNALHTFDGVAFIVEQMANALQKCDIAGAIVTPAAGSLHRLDLTKAGFPKAQNVLGQVQSIGRFADCAKRFRTFGRGTRHVAETPSMTPI